MTEAQIKITVTFERREDDGLRVWSEDLPGLVLSHKDIDAVLADVKTALEGILSERLGTSIQVRPLVNIREALEHNGVVDSAVPLPSIREYVAYHAH